tara:strand:+ start:1236 stop:1559 length:324 start_codon:yes stop_codon:yes gene_type:complete
MNFESEYERIERGSIVHIDDGYGGKGHFYVVLSIDWGNWTLEGLQITSAEWDYDEYTTIGPADHGRIRPGSRIKNEVYEFDYADIGRNFGPLSQRAMCAINKMQLRR